MKLTKEQFDQLDREGKREAVINFTAPDNLYTKESYIKLNEEKI